MTDSFLAKMYANFSLNKSTFIAYFLKAYKNSHILREREEYADASALPWNFVLSLANYDYIANSVSIAVAAMPPPLYAPGGTPPRSTGVSASGTRRKWFGLWIRHASGLT